MSQVNFTWRVSVSTSLNIISNKENDGIIVGLPTSSLNFLSFTPQLLSNAVLTHIAIQEERYTVEAKFDRIRPALKAHH